MRREIRFVSELSLRGDINPCILQGMEVHSGRWSPTSASAQVQFGGEEREEEEGEEGVSVVREVERKKKRRQGLGIMGWVGQALAVGLGLMILYTILVQS